jgi:hypothetical protein
MHFTIPLSGTDGSVAVQIAIHMWRLFGLAVKLNMILSYHNLCFELDSYGA